MYACMNPEACGSHLRLLWFCTFDVFGVYMLFEAAAPCALSLDCPITICFLMRGLHVKKAEGKEEETNEIDG